MTICGRHTKTLFFFVFWKKTKILCSYWKILCKYSLSEVKTFFVQTRSKILLKIISSFLLQQKKNQSVRNLISCHSFWRRHRRGFCHLSYRRTLQQYWQLPQPAPSSYSAWWPSYWWRAATRTKNNTMLFQCLAMENVYFLISYFFESWG